MEWREAFGVRVNCNGEVAGCYSGVPFLPPVFAGVRKVWRNRKHIPVHKIVCTAFHGERPSPAHTVDHINRDHTDNRACNLRWATKSEQRHNQVAHEGPHGKCNKVRYKKIGEETWSPVFESFGSLQAHLGCCSGEISMFFSGKRKSVAGCIFERVVDVIPDEEWKAMGNMEVSNMGRVKRKGLPPRFPRLGKGMEYIMTKFHGKSRPLHILVCIAFNGERPSEDHTVDHINGNKTDNRASNLRWATRKEQRENQRRKETAYRGHEVLGRKIGSEEWVHFKTRMHAERHSGAQAQNIAKCCNNQRKSCNGWEWKNA